MKGKMKGIILCVMMACLFPCDLLSAGRKENTNPDDRAKGPAWIKYRGFIGGMMIHTGYVGSKDLNITTLSGTGLGQKVNGAPFGLGGSIKFLFGKHLRVGAEGYVSTLTYGKYESHAETGWGGILADCVWNCGKKCRIFAGGTIGGGNQTNTTILSPVRDDYIAEECISYRKYAFFAIAPFIGLEYSLTPKVNVVLKIDRLINAGRSRGDFVSGPRLYLGILFGHIR